jgi:hypothetical protein
MSDTRHLDTPIVPQYPGIPRAPFFSVPEHGVSELDYRSVSAANPRAIIPAPAHADETTTPQH